MLKYLIIGTRSLIAYGVLMGMLYSYIAGVYGPRGRRILSVGSFLGLASAIVMA